MCGAFPKPFDPLSEIDENYTQGRACPPCFQPRLSRIECYTNVLARDTMSVRPIKGASPQGWKHGSLKTLQSRRDGI